MMAARTAAFAVVLALLAPSAFSAQSADGRAAALLARLTGDWRGSGTILGQASTVEMQWTPVLEGRFVRLTFTSHIGPAPKTQRFEGHAYYEVMRDGRVRATWFDNSGQTRPISATVATDALVSSWGTPETEMGETTYRLVSDREMQVIDRVRSKNGAWREFGRTTLSRTLPPR